MFDKQHEKINLANSWFSVLKLDTYKYRLQQTIYSYIGKQLGKNVNNWQEETRPSFLLPKIQERFRLPVERKDSILGLLKTRGHLAFLKRYIGKKNLLGISGELVEQATSEIAYFRLFATTNADAKDFYVLATHENFYEYLSGDAARQFIRKMIAGAGVKQVTIRFLIPDLLVHNDLTEKYTGKITHHEEALHQIRKKSDLLFDRFRTAFFNDPYLLSTAVNKDVLALVKEVKLVSIVIPYWSLVRYWSS